MVFTKSKEMLAMWGTVILIAALGMFLTFRWLVGSPLPEKLTMASGSPSGAYYWYAQRYAALIKERSGIEVEVRSTAGTVENLALLQQTDGGVDLAFVQSGVAAKDITGVQALASVNHEPLWVFYRKNAPFRYLSELTGKTLAIGHTGGGTRPVSLQLLKDNGVTADNATFSALGGAAATQALMEGKIDVGFFVAALESTYIQALMDQDDVAFMHFQRSASYTRRYDFLSAVSLPQGLLSLKDNRPSQTVDLLAMSTILAARTDLHPGLTPLLLEVAKTLHGDGSLIDSPGRFPTSDTNGLPGNKDAQQYFEKGPSFLYSVLPFQLASTIDRLKIMIVPLLTLLLPLFKLTPPLYRWRMRAKIYQWYGRVREQDLQITATASNEQLLAVRESLQAVEQDLKEVKVPLSFMEELYQLQLHIGYLQRQVEKALKAA